jgi:hypothetical protein
MIYEKVRHPGKSSWPLRKSRSVRKQRLKRRTTGNSAAENNLRNQVVIALRTRHRFKWNPMADIDAPALLRDAIRLAPVAKTCGPRDQLREALKQAGSTVPKTSLPAAHAGTENTPLTAAQIDH